MAPNRGNALRPICKDAGSGPALPTARNLIHYLSTNRLIQAVARNCANLRRIAPLSSKMEPVLEKLSSILTLAVVAGSWVSPERRIKSARLRLWTVGWVLVFAHFLMQLFEAGEGNLENLLQFVKLGSLQLASVFFIASLTSFLEDKKKTRLLIAVMAAPMLLFIAGFSFNWHLRLLDALCLACVFFGPPAFILSFRRRVTRESLMWMPIAIALGSWSIFKAWHSDPSVGFVILLTRGFAMPGLLLFTRYRLCS